MRTPAKIRTPKVGMGFWRVQVQVLLKVPRGYPCISLALICTPTNPHLQPSLPLPILSIHIPTHFTQPKTMIVMPPPGTNVISHDMCFIKLKRTLTYFIQAGLEQNLGQIFTFWVLISNLSAKIWCLWPKLWENLRVWIFFRPAGMTPHQQIYKKILAILGFSGCWQSCQVSRNSRIFHIDVHSHMFYTFWSYNPFHTSSLC